MSKRFWLALTAEIFWWLLVFIFCALIALPVYGIIHPDFLKIAIVLAAIFAAGFRFLIFTNQTVYLKPVPFKIIFVLAIPVITFLILGYIQDVVILFDNYDISGFLVKGDLQLSTTNINAKYKLFKNEFILFSVGSIILLALLELRLLLQLILMLRKIK